MPINEIDIESLPSGQIGITLEVQQIGPQGPTGPANTLSIGSVTSGETPSATITGSAPAQTLNLVLPKGDQGEAGADALWNFRGEWVGGPSGGYSIGDIVTHSGSLWYCLQPHYTAQDYPDLSPSIWELIAAKGEQGNQGPIGETGPANSLSIGTVTSGETPAATITGSAPNQTLNLVLEKGDKGDQGDAATLTLGTVSTGAAGSNVSITNSGTSSDAVFNFSIPRGDKGEKGDQGDAATISIGTVSTGAAGSSVSITNSGTAGAAVINFSIPRGDKGETGDVGPIGPVGPEPSLNVTDNAGTSITLADTDNNKIVRCTASSAVTVTVPSTLAAGFSCMVIQAGTGQVTFAAGSGATLNSFGNLLKTAGQHAPASIIRVGAGIYNLSGNLV